MHRFDQIDEREFYLGGFQNGISNGFAFVPLGLNNTGNAGSMADFNYRNGVLELDLYLGCCLFPNRYEMAGLWEANRNALFGFISRANYSVGGKVITEQGDIVPDAEILVTDYNTPSQMWYDSPSHTNAQGYFFRYMAPGDYFALVHAPGHPREFLYPHVDYVYRQFFDNITLETGERERC